mgnify:CR=1 FL=1
MLEASGNEGRDREEHREDLVSGSARAHAQPHRQTDQHVAQDAQGKRLPESEVELVGGDGNRLAPDLTTGELEVATGDDQ